ncbi:uncharacterized protein BX663DRAFT_511647 [Cokeromyces recurvatus]|uniref:uncharacterized protein n=1 Tax=Cokeromyces recurvatus TaxID=90255 RepID=UPI0022203AD0|nr:uncharacterized protein BX663DRAFT_511647 [Cokeromyces recurvatus]KAI7902068.1 hypothetical protein BX663DRAFT_511647 [Cokeromyces recurvatus]
MFMSLLHFKYILSIKGLLYIIIAAICLYFLQGYPQWKSRHCNKDSNDKQTLTNTIPINASVKQQQPTEKPKTNSTASLIHYVLVTPFAALYIMGRLLIDTIRYSLFYIIWSCERSIPYIDDWLFDFVTLSIPHTYSQIEEWWKQRGKPVCIHYVVLFKQNAIPSIIQWLEAFFITIYKVCCTVQISILQFIAAWKKFINRHDWHQLVYDLSTLAYNTCWVPLMRVAHLSILVYKGIHAIIISIKNEIEWICKVILPNMYNYLISTQLAHFTYQSFILISHYCEWMFKWINDSILVPIIGRLLTGTVKSIDRLVILLLEQHTIQKKIEKMYQAMAPYLVWIVLELSNLLMDILKGTMYIYHKLIYPSYLLFAKHVRPHLAHIYTMFMVRLSQWYHIYLEPLWYSYLSPFIYRVYMSLLMIMPIYHKLHNTIITLTTYITKQSWIYIQIISNKVFVVSVAYTEKIYHVIQIFLIEQAPTLSKILQKFYENIIHFYDWNELRRDITTAISTLYDWISEQSNLIYLSLERSLTEWVNNERNHHDDMLKKE